MNVSAKAKVTEKMSTQAPLTGAELAHSIVEFARGFSTEIAPHDEGLIPELAGALPGGTTVYVAHTPKATLADVVRIASKVQAAGLRASPHVVARRIESAQLLREGLRQLRDAKVEQVLLVAGDRNPPAGEFTSTLEILESGAIAEAGFSSVGVAGHPEGHPAVGHETLWDALARKQAYADRTGTRLHIATQFSFNPKAVFEWDRQLTEHGVTLPVHIGMAGPTPLPKLIKYAMMCGIGASLGKLGTGLGLVGRVAGLATSPDEMLIELVKGRAAQGATHITQPHVYAFGGVMATVKWLRAVIDGRFELDRSGEKFSVKE